MPRIAGLLETPRQRSKFLFPLRDIPLVGIERGRDFANLRDRLANRRLLVPDLVQAAVDATG